MSQMRSPGSGIKLTASASIFQIPIQLIFIEQVYLAGNDLGTSTYAILRTVVKALQGSNIMATVKMRLSDSFKVTQLSVAGPDLLGTAQTLPPLCSLSLVPLSQRGHL